MGIFNLNSPLMRGMGKVINTIYLGILWFVCSIPVVTIGASTVAMYEVILKLIKGEEGNITASFFKGFKSNFRQATGVWLMVLLVLAVFIVNLLYYGLLAGTPNKPMLLIFGILLLLALGVFCWLFPLMARTENSVLGHLRVVLILTVRNPAWSVLMVVDLLLALLVIYVFYYAPLLFIMGPLGYLQGTVFNTVFDRLIRRGMIREEHPEGGEA